MAQKAIPETLARQLKGGRAERALIVDRQAIDEAARTATLAFASETPYERYWGVEILDCKATSIRTGRLSTGANLLCDHDGTDVVGVIESVEIGVDLVVRAVVRFGKSVRAEEVWQDVLGGIRRSVSVGYMIHKATLVEENEGVETFRVTDWEPFEISLVSVPADASVGVGRSLESSSDTATKAPEVETPAPTVPTQKETQMSTIEVVATRNHAAEISKVASTIPGGADMAMSAIQRGLTVEQFQSEALESMAKRPLPTADIGLTAKEVRSYSMLRALNALANPNDQAAQRAAAFEQECSNAASTRSGKASQGMMVPSEIQRRDLNVGTTTAGGNLVATDLLGGSFIEMLRNAMVIDQLGVTMLSGLVGNLSVPRQSGAATAYWVAEGSSPTESQQTIGQVPLAPKTVGAFTDIGRRLLLQSSISVESMVQNDLAKSLGLAIQQAAINGTGANGQPSGLLTLLAASVVGGAAPTWRDIIALETAVSTANAEVGTLAYLTNAKVRGALKGTEKFASSNGSPVWQDGNTPLNGYRAGVTNAVPSNLGTGGDGSAIVFGNFADLVIGMWGGLDMMVDPYTGGTAGTVRIITLQDVDVALRNAESFATMVDAITA